MAHSHKVLDTDSYFIINPISRAISNLSSGKKALIQGDHNSERFTFEGQRFVDGHDLSLCNSVQIHYINIDLRDKDVTSSDVYSVDDLQVSPDSDDLIILSWLISSNATKYVGSLSFAITFKCISDDGTVDYSWSTAIFTGVSICQGINNSEEIAEEYSDVLEQWKREMYSRIDNIESKVENIEIPEIPEFPASLPNPNAITFTGAVNASYDGSEAVTVNIPDSGSGTDSNSVHYTLDIDKTEEEKAQARTNIGAVGVNELAAVNIQCYWRENTTDVNTALENIAEEIDDKVSTSDVQETEITKSGNAVTNMESDETLITPKAVQTLINRLLMPPIIFSDSYSVSGADEWIENSTSSTKGQFITKSGSLYICIANSSAGTWTQRKANYSIITRSESQREYSSSKTYNTGDTCYKPTKGAYNAHMYVCIADGTTGNFDGTKWQDVGEVMTVSSDVDFRKYTTAFENFTAKLSNGSICFWQEQYLSDYRAVAFRFIGPKGSIFYLIYYNADGSINKTRYSSASFIME